jgi:hypothetical protein
LNPALTPDALANDGNAAMLNKLRSFAAEFLKWRSAEPHRWVHRMARINRHKHAWRFLGPAVLSMREHGMTDQEIASHLEGIARLIRRHDIASLQDVKALFR